MFRRARQLFEYLFRRRLVEDDIDRELQSSFAAMVDEYVGRGMTASEAHRAARLEFDSLERVKDAVRDRLVGARMGVLLQDVRYAWRGLIKARSFTLIAVITLALGIGVNTGVFSVFYAVLMRPLPYRDPGQLVSIWANFRSRGSAQVAVSGGLLRDIELRQRSMEDVAGIWVTPPRTLPGDPPEQVKAALVTVNFFDVLGVRAALGRTFVKEDGGGPNFLVTDSLFRRRPDSSGLSIFLGVLPADFRLYFPPEANVPEDVPLFTAYDSDVYNNPNYIIRLVARLKPDVSLMQAQQDFDRIAGEVRARNGEFAREDLHFRIAGMQEHAFRDVRPALTALFAGGALILLISCVNVISILLARASSRHKEIALRLALGGSRGRILQQLFIEAGVLSLIGGVAGFGVGWGLFRALLAIRPERLARLGEGGLLWPVVFFAISASVIATTLFGLAPALQCFRIDQMETLRVRGREWLGRVQRRAGRALVVAEIALAFLLVTAALLTARTLWNIERARPGFEPRQVLAFQLRGMPAKTIADWESRFASIPGIESVGAISHLPFDKTVGNWYGEYRVRLRERVVSSTADNRAVTPGYMTTMGIRLLEGRYFDLQDRSGSRNVVIIDETLARSMWPGESAIGKVIEAEHMTEHGTPFELLSSVVVGVVEHVHNHSLTQEIRAQIYSPFEQNRRDGYPQTFVARTSGPPLSVVPAVRAALRDKDRRLAADKVQAMSDYVEREIAPASFTAALAVIFGGLALLLAAIGIYGVLNYQVSRRLPEMGIRMAVGATARDVFGLVLREGFVITAAGLLLGAGAAIGGSRWLSSLLYGVSPTDPLSYAFGLLLLPAAALLGCWRPAWRAAATNPVEIIHEE